MKSKRRTSKIAIFNHKGGVGKTTLTLNIAAEIAALGKRVLLVDADPQCNLTSYLLDDATVDDLLERSDGPHGKTIWSSVKPIVEADLDIVQVKPFELSINGLFLLPGDIRLTEFEAVLGQCWSDCLARKIKAFRGVSAISSLIKRICKDYDIDYVFFDTGPNIGPLNRNIILDCDFLIIPVACDVFSVRALKTLGRAMAAWIQDWRRILSLAPDQVDKLSGVPKLLGVIPQRFRAYRGTVTQAQQKYFSQIDKHVRTDVIAVLREVDPTLVRSVPGNLFLGEVKDFGSLATKSQEKGVPIATVKAGTPAQRAEAKTTFAAIAKKIIQRTGGK